MFFFLLLNLYSFIISLIKLILPRFLFILLYLNSPFLLPIPFFPIVIIDVITVTIPTISLTNLLYHLIFIILFIIIILLLLLLF